MFCGEGEIQDAALRIKDGMIRWGVYLGFDVIHKFQLRVKEGHLYNC